MIEFTKFIVIIISWCISESDHYAEHLKSVCVQVNYIAIKQKKKWKKEKEEAVRTQTQREKMMWKTWGEDGCPQSRREVSLRLLSVAWVCSWASWSWQRRGLEGKVGREGSRDSGKSIILPEKLNSLVFAEARIRMCNLLLLLLLIRVMSTELFLGQWLSGKGGLYHIYIS